MIYVRHLECWKSWDTLVNLEQATLAVSKPNGGTVWPMLKVTHGSMLKGWRCHGGGKAIAKQIHFFYVVVEYAYSTWLFLKVQNSQKSYVLH
jgi:hypothetical protein